MDARGDLRGDERATGWTNDDTPRLIRDAYPEGPEAEDPFGQAELLAWIVREMDYRPRSIRCAPQPTAVGVVCHATAVAGPRSNQPI